MSKQTIQVVTLWSAREKAGSCYSEPYSAAVGIGFSKESALKELVKQGFASRLIDGAYSDARDIPLLDRQDEHWTETDTELRVSWETREID